ncbi:IS982 family transposase [Hymenobacter rubripertinctus]|uniref:IS982 family transposase n=1 Tax=Hymenobacter rubripertinctus TaxID=2029981 RepID=A0A418QIC0_9BACT|nr:IS982 family transposase [Hymenobacter rubripertinctus]RIY04923.1 IS982 family transposase [Hymenobacter rubripertinctus]
MTEQTVAMYCFIDDFLRLTRPQAPHKRHLSDAEIITTALLAARFFGGNLAAARRYMRQHWGMKALDKSGFTRQLHRLHDTLKYLFFALGQHLKQLNTEARYVIDSFPVPVCDNVRISRSQLLEGEAYRGYSASKRRYFYGFKVQLLMTHDGLPVEFYIHAGSEADITGLKALDPQLPAGSVLYADAAYTDYALEDAWYALEEVALTVDRKKGSKRPHEPWQNFLIQYFRKGIETTISQITERFPKSIHAVTAQGFALKLLLFIFTHTLAELGA